MVDPYDRIRSSLKGGDTVVLGGPIGSELVRRGVRWRGHGMLTDADAVRAIYHEYLAAGADVLRTNTFQLNRRIYRDVFRDEAHMRHIGAPGLEQRAGDLTRRAVELARAAREDAGRPDAAIAGVLSPLEHCFRPDLAPDPETAHAEHAELAGIMAAAGVDLLLLEPMNALPEARAAADAAHATGLPYWASFVLGPDLRVLGGESLADAARVMRDCGAQAVLVNCVPPGDVAPALAALANGGATGAFPHVGRFDPPSWKFEFFPRFGQTDAWPPARLAEQAVAWRSGGARIVGGCCGSGPDHTAALALSRGPQSRVASRERPGLGIGDSRFGIRS